LASSLLLLGIAIPANADWPPGGKRMAQVWYSINFTYSMRFAETSSGDLELLLVGKCGNQNGYSLQRVTRNGDIAPGWPADGVPMGTFGADGVMVAQYRSRGVRVVVSR
jgi:hypothetical protein